MQWPWVSRALYRNALRQLVAERRRAESAFKALDAERQRCDRMVRHLTSQFLRKQNAYGLPEEKVAVPAEPMPSRPPLQYDPGELKALIDEAKRHGLSEDDAKSFFMREKNIDVLM